MFSATGPQERLSEEKRHQQPRGFEAIFKKGDTYPSDYSTTTMADSGATTFSLCMVAIVLICTPILLVLRWGNHFNLRTLQFIIIA